MHAQPVTNIDRELAELAHRQYGIVSRDQLLALGLTPDAIDWRVRRSRLLPQFRGVYAVGHVTRGARSAWWAAVLACGGPGRAVLSHLSAAALWDLLAMPVGPVDVIVLGRSHPRGIRVHRSRTLAPEDVTTDLDGLPVTTVTRTLADLATAVPPRTLRRALHRAELLRLVDAPALAAGRSHALRAAVAELRATGPALTRSELEERLLAVIEAHGLPRPLVNARVVGLEVDFLWPEQRVIVETDGAAAHLTASAFEADRRRDARLIVAGYRVVRFTWRQVVEEPDAVAATIAALLATSGPA